MGLEFKNSPKVVPLQYVVKNSFIHIVDEEDSNDENVSQRPRAVSEFTGTRLVDREKSEHSTRFIPAFPPLRTNDEDVELHGSASPSTETTRRGASCSSLGQVSDGDARTTVMLRNIPNAYTSNSFVELFDTHGFWGRYDFVYLPIDFRTGVNLGYAFVNFVSHRDADLFKAHFHGFRQWFCQSPKVCEVTWTDPHQGLEEHIERYRNSPVMHEDISDIYKPRLYAGGQRLAFPPPTKRIRPPRIRPQKFRPPRDHDDVAERLPVLCDSTLS